MWVATVCVVAAFYASGVESTGYQPYQYTGLHHQRSNEQAALDYQKQILQWQQAVAQRAPNNSPFITRGYGDYRQEVPVVLPPQPTIQAPLPPGPPETPPTLSPTPPPYPEVDNQLGGETTVPPSQDPLRALCKAPRGQFPGTSCGKFVNCWDDVVVEQNCPLGLHFNELSGYCDYAFNVACSDQPGPQPGVVEGPGGVSSPGGVGSPGQAPGADLGAPGARCPTEYGTYRSTKNCGVFYMCVGYLPVEFTCPAGLNFHKDLQVCDYPYRVECDGVPSNQPPPEVTTVPEAETTYPPPPPVPAEPAPLPDLQASSPPLVLTPEPTPAVAPPATSTPEAYYNLKKVPASLVDPGVPCRPNTVYRLNPTCSSVAVCRNGVTQVLNCGPGTSYDINSEQCLSLFRARC